MPQLELRIKQPQYTAKSLGCPELWHFMFKMQSLSQLT